MEFEAEADVECEPECDPCGILVGEKWLDKVAAADGEGNDFGDADAFARGDNDDDRVGCC